jgi:hypothetical protein
MLKPRRFLGLNLVVAVVILLSLLFSTVLVLIILSQPVEPVVDLRTPLPERREYAPAGFVRGMNASADGVINLSQIFDVEGIPEKVENGWIIKNGSRSLLLIEPRHIQLYDYGFRCNTSNARQRTDFPDPEVVFDAVEKRLIESGFFPGYARSLDAVHETTDPESGGVCLIGARFSYRIEGILLDGGAEVSIDYKGYIIEFRSDLFSISTGEKQRVMDPQSVMDSLKRSTSHNFWSGSEYVEKLVIYRFALLYTYPSSGWRADLRYEIEYDMLFASGLIHHEKIDTDAYLG